MPARFWRRSRANQGPEPAMANYPPPAVRPSYALPMDELLRMSFDELRASISLSSPARTGVCPPSTRMLLRLPFVDFAPAPDPNYQSVAATLQRGSRTRGSLRAFRPRAAEPGTSYEALLALDNNRVKRGVMQAAFERLPRVPAAEFAGQECHVCMDKYSKGSGVVVRLPCDHAFCHECIRPWLVEQHSCPVCRWHFPDKDTQLLYA